MADQKKSSKFGRNSTKCASYRSRENTNKTAKTRRVLRALKAGIKQPGWMLRSDGKLCMRDPAHRPSKSTA